MIRAILMTKSVFNDNTVSIIRLQSFYYGIDRKKCLLKLNIGNIYLQSNLLRPWSW